jgi:hypothetical protein
MKSRSKKGSKRRYIGARDVLADIPSPAIAQRLKVEPNVSDAKRLRIKAAASPRRKSARAEASAALGVFLDHWEKEHGPITSVELDRASKELRRLRALCARRPPPRTGLASIAASGSITRRGR